MTNIHQHDRSDCGAACLAGIARHYGKPLSVAHIRLSAGTGASGTTLSDLRRAAEKTGFQAEAVSGDYDGLRQAILPAIVHLDHADTGNHFVVVTRTGTCTVTVLDPADGRRHRWRLERFLAYWSGAALLLLPGPSFLADEVEPARTVTRRMIQFLLPYRRQLLLALLATALAMAGALFVRLFTDRVVDAQDPTALHRLGAVFAAVLFVQVSASAVRKSITLHTARQIDNRLLRAYCRHLLHLPQQLFNGMQPGELLDEATSALYADTETLVLRLLRRRRAAGMAILWISHRADGSALADATYRQEDGALTLQTDRPTYHPSQQHGNAATAAPDRGVAARPGNANLNGHGPRHTG